MKDLVRLGIVLAVLAAAAVGFVALQQRKGYALKVGEPAPAFELAVLDGARTSLAQHKGRVVLVNLWATWCPPCLEEMPSLERLHQRLKGDGLVVLGISVDESESEIRDTLKKIPVSFSILRDPDESTARAYRTTAYPETFLIDRQGVLHRIFVGPMEWDSAEMTQLIRDLIKRQ